MKLGHIKEYEAYYSTHDGLHFKIGNMECWEVKNGYMTAKLIDNTYCDHIEYDNLEDALLRLRKTA
jgi:hypothetical protein